MGRDRRTTFSRNSLASCSQKLANYGNTERINSDPIPVDLTIEILSRLPAKSLVKFQRVSKLWSSIITSRDFINSFVSQSSTHPCLLFTFAFAGCCKRFVFSLPYPQNASKESSSAANHDLTIPGMSYSLKLSNSVRGLICYEVLCQVQVCNPSTRQIVALPKIEFESPRLRCKGVILGYDSINDQYKVLCTMGSHNNRKPMSLKRWVFTLGAGNSWRRIRCGNPHYPSKSGVCIDGVLYYAAWTDARNRVDSCTMASFDVRSEKFSLSKVSGATAEVLMHASSTLINFEGKVAMADWANLMTEGRIDLWILKDAKKEEWSKIICVLPPSWRDSAGKTEFYVPGNAHTGEIILAPSFPSNPFCLFSYDLKRNNLKRVEIKGIPDHVFKHRNRRGNISFSVPTLTDHVENIMFL